MCGRYASVASRADLLERFVVDESNADELRGQDFNVTPTKDNPVELGRKAGWQVFVIGREPSDEELVEIRIPAGSVKAAPHLSDRETTRNPAWPVSDRRGVRRPPPRPRSVPAPAWNAQASDAPRPRSTG